jgi:hypothetical protein
VLKAMAQSLTFEVPKADAIDAWGRAQTFVAQHSTMKIQLLSDYVIETYNPVFDPQTDAGFGTMIMKYGYTITRNALGDKMRFSVECKGTPSGYGAKQIAATADRNAHLAAHFIKTGELPYPELVIK